MQHEREFDIVLWGATGYTGQLVARALYDDAGSARIALAGRNQAKLEAVRAELGAETWPLLVGDRLDTAFLETMASRTLVVCTTVGPYDGTGDALVEVCARLGTSYCDLTGEVHWMRRMIDAHANTAERSGARLVHCCGFDSIPSDLGVYFLQQRALSQLGKPCVEVRGCFTRLRGGLSGGTFASLRNAVVEAARDPAVRKLFADPYGLNPEGERAGADRRERAIPARDPEFGWTAPFVMAVVNTKVVRRSNALLGYRYGRDFRYSETFGTGRGALGGVIAWTATGVISSFALAIALPPLRAVVERLGPKPGEGPSEAQREAGGFVLELIGDVDGQTVRARVTGNRDPGYGATAHMLAQSALCLSLDRDRLPSGGGSLTPAAAIGDCLIERLGRVGIVFGE